MGNSIKRLAEKVEKISNGYENNNSELKRKYLIYNIYTFNNIVSSISGNCGSFGTGYPFYVLNRDLTGKLPIIEEQRRYNHELVQYAELSNKSIWKCKKCLTESYDKMTDLKQICNSCNIMDNTLKPRKIMNRLPDIDMWMICEDEHIQKAKIELSKLLKESHIHTSDVDPLNTLKEIEEITEELKKGIMPKRFLPIDAHIIKYSEIKELIKRVPFILEQAKEDNQIPFLPIHPLSYRKKWQYDDTPYNFIFDFLASFTEFNIDSELSKMLKNTRDTLIYKYSEVELFSFLLESGANSTLRRFRTPELQLAFLSRIGLWKGEIDNKRIYGKGENEEWER